MTFEAVSEKTFFEIPFEINLAKPSRPGGSLKFALFTRD